MTYRKITESRLEEYNNIIRILKTKDVPLNSIASLEEKLKKTKSDYYKTTGFGRYKEISKKDFFSTEYQRQTAKLYYQLEELVQIKKANLMNQGNYKTINKILSGETKENRLWTKRSKNIVNYISENKKNIQTEEIEYAIKKLEKQNIKASKIYSSNKKDSYDFQSKKLIDSIEELKKIYLDRLDLEKNKPIMTFERKKNSRKVQIGGDKTDMNEGIVRVYLGKPKNPPEAIPPRTKSEEYRIKKRDLLRKAKKTLATGVAFLTLTGAITFPTPADIYNKDIQQETKIFRRTLSPEILAKAQEIKCKEIMQKSTRQDFTMTKKNATKGDKFFIKFTKGNAKVITGYYLTMVQEPRNPSTLIELGNGNNPSDLENILRNPSEWANKIVKGIINLGVKDVYINPGHGGNDPGAIFKYKGESISEASINAQISKEVISGLRRQEVEAKLLHEEDKNLTSSERIQSYLTEARRNPNRMIISLHVDSRPENQRGSLIFVKENKKDIRAGIALAKALSSPQEILLANK